jgi:8-hydroxy-5-deazaflavin:NADPH oxidoreductase
LTKRRASVAVIGGTGALGNGLAQRLARAGHAVIIGSRSVEKARHAAATIEPGDGAPPVRGMDNTAAAAAAQIVLLTVPYASHAAILGEIRDVTQGKILINASVPLAPPDVATVRTPAEGSAAQASQRILGDGVFVVSAFQNVAARKLKKDGAIDCDILVCADHKPARATVIALIESMGMRALDAGPLANAIAAEALTPVLININRRYKVAAAGIRITGVPGGDT